MSKAQSINCCDIFKPQDIITFRLDSDNNNNIIKILENSKSVEKNNKSNLLNNSSLRNVEVHRRKSKFSNFSKEPYFFSSSNLNENIPEDFNINMNENKKLYDYFFSKIIDEINNKRSDLLGFSKLLIKLSDDIKKDEDGFSYLICNGEKYYFEYNRKDILEHSEKIKNLDLELKKKNISLKKFEYLEELTIPLSDINLKKIFEKNSLEILYKELKEKFKDIYNIEKLLFFKSTRDPEIVIVKKFIEDLKRKDRRIFLSDTIEFINFNFKAVDGMIFVFIVFAKRI